MRQYATKTIVVFRRSATIRYNQYVEFGRSATICYNHCDKYTTLLFPRVKVEDRLKFALLSRDLWRFLNLLNSVEFCSTACFVQSKTAEDFLSQDFLCFYLIFHIMASRKAREISQESMEASTNVPGRRMSKRIRDKEDIAPDSAVAGPSCSSRPKKKLNYNPASFHMEKRVLRYKGESIGVKGKKPRFKGGEKPRFKGVKT